MGSNSNHAITFTYGLIPLEKAWNRLSVPPTMSKILSQLFFNKDSFKNWISHEGLYDEYWLER